MKWTLTKKMLPAVGIVTFCSFGLMGLVIYQNMATSERKVLAETLDAANERLKTSLVEPIWNMNGELLRTVIAGELRSQHISAITVYEGAPGKEKFLVGFDKQKGAIVEIKDPKNASNGAVWERKFVVVHGKETIAVVTLYATDHVIRQRLQELAIFVAAGCLLLCVAVVAMLYFILQRTVLSPLQALSAKLENIASGEGDLTQRIDVSSSDEFADLARVFNRFVERLQTTIKEVSACVVAVNDSSRELATSADDLSQTIRGAQAQSSSVAASDNLLGATIRSMADSSRSISENATSVSAAVEEMSVGLKDVASNCASGSDIATNAQAQATSAQASMTRLEESVRQVSSIVAIIDRIASQTNLLALNATIEAASAGEAGRGFAVVASEVKDLARQSAQSTEEIRKQIAAMQQNSDSAILAIQTIAGTIDQMQQASLAIASTSEQQAMATTEIARAMSESNRATQELANNIGEASAASRKVAESIGQMQTCNENASRVAVATDANSKQLASMARRLNELLSHFKI